MLQRFSLVNCNVIGFVTLDDVLRLVLRSMVQIAFEANVGDNLLNDHATNSSAFRVPFNLVTALERLRHPTANNWNNCERTRSGDAISKACQWVRYNFGITEAEISGERACKRRPAKHLDVLPPLLEGRRSLQLSYGRVGYIDSKSFIADNDTILEALTSRPSQELLSGQKKVNRIGARCAGAIGISTNSIPKTVAADAVSLTVRHSSPLQCRWKGAGTWTRSL